MTCSDGPPMFRRVITRAMRIGACGPTLWPSIATATAMRVPTLDTPRLRIRELVEADLEAIAPLDATPSWLRWTIASYAELDALHQPPYGDRAIALASGAVVGL